MSAAAIPSQSASSWATKTPAFAAETPLIRDALTELGAKDDPMDAKDNLSNPIALITDPAKSVNNPDNPKISAGFTFRGRERLQWESDRPANV